MQCGGSSGRTMTVENTGAKKVLTSEFSNWQRSSIACTSAGYRSARTSERINWRGVHDTCPSNTRPESLKQSVPGSQGWAWEKLTLMTGVVREDDPGSCHHCCNEPILFSAAPSELSRPHLGVRRTAASDRATNCNWFECMSKGA